MHRVGSLSYLSSHLISILPSGRKGAARSFTIARRKDKVNSKKEMVTLKIENRLMPEKHQPNDGSIPTGSSWQV